MHIVERQRPEHMYQNLMCWLIYMYSNFLFLSIITDTMGKTKVKQPEKVQGKPQQAKRQLTKPVPIKPQPAKPQLIQPQPAKPQPQQVKPAQGKSQQKAQSKRASKTRSFLAQDDIELLMECFEEALSPAQLKAIEVAQAEHERANNQIKEIRAGNTLVPSSQPNTFTIVPPAPKPQPAPPPAPPQVPEPRAFPVPAKPQAKPPQVMQSKSPAVSPTVVQQNERMLAALRVQQAPQKPPGELILLFD